MVKPIVSAINNRKTMGGRHAVHERQAVLSTTVVISHTFCMENETELTPEGRCNNHVMLSCKSAIENTPSQNSLVPRHQIFRARPAALSKNRVWTRSLVKRDALCSQHLECGSNCGHVLPVPRPLIRARTRTRTQAIRAKQRCLSLFKTRKKKAMKYPFPVPSPNPNPNCNTKS